MAGDRAPFHVQHRTRRERAKIYEKQQQKVEINRRIYTNIMQRINSWFLKN